MNPSTMLFQEERKSTKLFLWVTNCAFIISNAFSEFYTFEYGHLKDVILSVSLCVIILCMLFIGIYFIKNGNSCVIKYMYLIGYLVGEFFNIVLMYTIHSNYIGIWSVLEFILILFVPIFMSKKYFWILTASLLVKYSVISVVLQKSSAFIVMGVIILLLSVFYILLVRFQSYIEAINKMFKETKQKQQLAVMGKMAATVGHEIRNPLTALKGFTQLQKEKHPHDLVYRNMMEEIEQMNEMISELMVLGKPKSQQYSMYSVKQLLLAAIAAEEQQISQKKIKISKFFSEEISNIECDVKQMNYVFVHIIKKVIEIMKYGRSINIGTYIIAENYILIHIGDERQKINKKKMGNINDFFGTEQENDFGLGLMAVYKIVNEHQGKIRFNHVINVGSEIKIVLPIKHRESQ